MLPDFKDARVLVVGDVMLDRYWHGDAARISPEAPVPVVKVNEVEERLGGAANVAFNLSVLGCDVALLGYIGDDKCGKSISNYLSSQKISDQLLVDSNCPTITKLRIVSQQQQLIRLDFEEKIQSSQNSGMLEKFKRIVVNYDAVIFSDYAKGTLGQIEGLIKIAKDFKKIIVVDPKGTNFDKYKNATLITPNASEFVGVMGRYENQEMLEVLAKKLIKRLSLNAILVTRGEDGMSLITENHSRHIPALAREVFDVTGAGDTVISTLTAALACNKSLEQSAELANVAAGIVVAKLGTASVSEPELRGALKQHDEHFLGVVTKSQLLDVIADARTRNEKIVMTNGCFDILHSGHVTYLEQARKLGDRLIVAVNDDSSVRRLKGSKRPIVPLEERMAILAGLSSVDWVVSFSQDTPESLICEILPDVLVKGGDYKAQEVAGYQCVTSNGGNVEVMDFIDGLSTSNIVEKIRNI